MKITRFFSVITLLLILFSSWAPVYAQENSNENSQENSEELLLEGKVQKSHVQNLSEKCKNTDFTKDETDYVLGPNDVISISLLAAPELNKDHLRVLPSGKIILDILDEPMKVEGMTMTQLYCELTSAYDKILQDPRLTLDLVESKPFIIYVTGAVLSPGSYEFITQAYRQPPQSMPEISINRTSPILSNVLVAAGGISYNADLQHIKIENKTLGTERVVNLLELLKGDNSQDLRLVKGDVVFVPRNNTMINEADYRLYANSSFSPKTIPVKVYGYVNNPGLIKLETAQSLNLMSAITSAGGYQSGSKFYPSGYAPSKVYIYRPVNEEGRLVPFPVNPKTQDITLFPNDIVYVPINKPTRVGLFFDYMTRLINPAYHGAATYQGFTGNPLF